MIELCEVHAETTACSQSFTENPATPLPAEGNAKRLVSKARPLSRQLYFNHSHFLILIRRFTKNHCFHSFLYVVAEELDIPTLKSIIFIDRQVFNLRLCVWQAFLGAHSSEVDWKKTYSKEMDWGGGFTVPGSGGVFRERRKAIRCSIS